MEQAANYCRKDGDFWEYGELPEDKEQGKRSDLDRVKEMMDDGASMQQVATTEFSAFVKFYRGFQKYQTLTTSERDFKTQVIVITGDPGTFKSYALSRLRGRYHVVRPTAKGSGCWYDGYEPHQHATIIYDDFTGGWMPYNNLLEICDRYGAQVQSKGGTLQFRPLVVGLTSNYPADTWYSGMDYAALERRIDLHFTHKRCDAPNDDLGLATGDIVVERLKGHIGFHPLHAYLEQCDGNLYKFKEEFQLELMETQPDIDTTGDFWATMLQEMEIPNPVDDPELSDDVPRPKLPPGLDEVQEISSDSEIDGESIDDSSPISSQ